MLFSVVVFFNHMLEYIANNSRLLKGPLRICVSPSFFRVIEHGEVNRMTTQSVAIVFGPTLLRPETETGNMAVHMVYQNQIVELILLEYDNIFGR